MQKFLPAIPLSIAACIGFAGWWGLNADRDPGTILSVLIGKSVPQFELPPIEEIDTPGLATQDIKSRNEIVLVNIFASWCLPCRAEHSVLSQLVHEENLFLVGINYKDSPVSAAKWLAELGNPYRHIGSDQTGRTGIEWGISGVPETFIVSTDGKILFRFTGPISDAAALAKFRDALNVAVRNNS